jgi:endonuclease YncB( thermonuclease family)
MHTTQFWITLAITAVLSFLGGSVSGMEWAGFGRTHPAISVVDGDTIKLGAQSLRLLNIDAPEVGRAECPEERERGLQATERLKALMAEGAISIHPNGKADRYGRPLIRLQTNARDVGDRLITEGLAKPWPVQGNPSWCPGIS